MTKDHFIESVKHSIASNEAWRGDFLPITLKSVHEWLKDIGIEIQGFEMPYGLEIKTLLVFDGKKYIFCFDAFEGSFCFRRNVVFSYLFNCGQYMATDLFKDESRIYYCREHNIIIEVDSSCFMHYCPHCGMNRMNLKTVPDGEYDCILNFINKNGEYQTKKLFRALIKDKTISKIED